MTTENEKLEIRKFTVEDLQRQRCEDHELGKMWEDRWDAYDFWDKRCTSDMIGKPKDYVSRDNTVFTHEERQNELMLLSDKILRMFNEDPTLALDSGSQLNKFIELASKLAETAKPLKFANLYTKDQLAELTHSELVEVLMAEYLQDLPQHRRNDYLNMTTELIGKTFNEFESMKRQFAVLTSMVNSQTHKHNF